MKRLYRMLVNGKSNEGPVLIALGMIFGAGYVANLHVAPVVMNVPVYLAVMGCVAAVLMIYSGVEWWQNACFQQLTEDALTTCKQSQDQVVRLLEIVRSLNGDITRLANANRQARADVGNLLECVHRLHMMDEQLPADAREVINATLRTYHGWSERLH